MKKQRSIMHLDGDAFFVSVEAAKDPRLRGKPVVTGQERGIASALSYEAKKLGITRAMPVFQIRKQFPQVIIVDSDYESYAIFSGRMFDIVRRYTDAIEEYSIDECFADFTDVAEFHRDPRALLARIKREIATELGISVSLGLGPTKVLAKTASKSQKPDGLTFVAPGDVPALLDKTPVDKVWGIGSATAFALRKKGVSTALGLARKPLDWVEEHFSKPMAEMWYELNCISVKEIGGASGGEAQKSIMTTRTFWPASSDKARVFSELAKNIETACKRAREIGLSAREFSIHLKARDFSYSREWCRLAAATDNPFDVLAEARRLFERLFDPLGAYRATGIALYSLVPTDMRHVDLFGALAAKKDAGRLFKTLDKLNKKHGGPLVHIATSSQAFVRAGERDHREIVRRLSIPYLGEAS